MISTIVDNENMTAKGERWAIAGHVEKRKKSKKALCML